MAGTPNKIVLKSTTKMSLNDRFAAIRKSAESTVNAIRQRMRQSRQASSKNLRLVQQMENRPSVIAALKLKKRSMRQRLGPATSGTATDLKSRLTMGSRRSGRGGGGGFAASNRSPRGGSQQNGRDQRFRINRSGPGQLNKDGIRTVGRMRTNSRRGMSPLIRSRGSGNKFSFGGNTINNQGRGNIGRTRMNRGRDGNFRGRSFNQRNQSGGGGDIRQNRGGGGGRFRSGRGNGRRIQTGRGRGGAQMKWGNAAPPSKQQLDSELDEYMAKSRGYLDSELDHYMSQND